MFSELIPKDINFRLVKIADIGYITILYFLTGLISALILCFLFSLYTKIVGRSKNITIIMLELVILMWLVGAFTYIVKNIVEIIPSPFEGMQGLKHKNVKELGSAGVYGVILISLSYVITDRLGDITSWIKTIL
jgi:hypothetical protein